MMIMMIIMSCRYQYTDDDKSSANPSYNNSIASQGDITRRIAAENYLTLVLQGDTHHPHPYSEEGIEMVSMEKANWKEHAYQRV